MSKITIPNNVEIDKIKSLIDCYNDGEMTDEEIGQVVSLFKAVRAYLEHTGNCNALKYQLNRDIEGLNNCIDYRERIDKYYEDSPFGKTPC